MKPTNKYPKLSGYSFDRLADKEQITVCLSPEELKLLSSLLSQGFDPDEDDGSPTYKLYSKLQHVYYEGAKLIYVSLYEMPEAYGGPEEGGWTYPQRELLYTRGFMLLSSQLEHIAAEFNQLIKQVELEGTLSDSDIPTCSMPQIEAGFITVEDLEINKLPFRFTYESCGYLITIEPYPGQSADTQRHYYS